MNVSTIDSTRIRCVTSLTSMGVVEWIFEGSGHADGDGEESDRDEDGRDENEPTRFGPQSGGPAYLRLRFFFLARLCGRSS